MSNFDQRVAMFQGSNGSGFKSSANAAIRGGRGGSRHHGPPRGKSKGNGSGNYSNSNGGGAPRTGAGGRPSSNNNRGRRSSSRIAPMLSAVIYAESWATPLKTAGTGSRKMKVTPPRTKKLLVLPKLHTV